MYTILYTRRGVRHQAKFDALEEAERFACYVLEPANLEWGIFGRAMTPLRENDDGKPWSWEL